MVQTRTKKSASLLDGVSGLDENKINKKSPHSIDTYIWLSLWHDRTDDMLNSDIELWCVQPLERI